MRNPDSDNYGRYYWVVDVERTISANGWLSLFADEMNVNANGDLVFICHSPKDEGRKFTGLTLQSGKWVSAYAADLWIGDPVVVDKWECPEEVNSCPGRAQSASR